MLGAAGLTLEVGLEGAIGRSLEVVAKDLDVDLVENVK